MDPIHVMTFNLRGSFIPDGVNSWPNRAPLAVGLLRRESPDLIGFQEAQQGNLDVLTSSLPEYRMVEGPPYNNRDPFAHNAVYWVPRRMEKVESGGFWLSRTPDCHSGDWDTDCIRSAVWNRFRLLPEGTEFIHLNTHLDHISAPARREGTMLILEKLRPFILEGLPLLLTGDFNANPGSDPHRLFLEGGFEDLFDHAGGVEEDEAFTFHGFTGGRIPGEERIDWILARPGRGLEWRVRHHRVLTEADPPVYPSDHYPVSAGLELLPSGR